MQLLRRVGNEQATCNGMRRGPQMHCGARTPLPRLKREEKNPRLTADLALEALAEAPRDLQGWLAPWPRAALR